MRFSGIIVFVAQLCCLYTVKAQQLRFDNFTTRNGLSNNDITCVYEDRQGFIWVGTRNGLNRFDGRMFQVFRNNPADTNSLSGNNIIDLLQDKQGILWIATKDGGLTRYDAKARPGKEFRQFRYNPKNSKSIGTNRLICLYDWDEDYLLIGAEVLPGIFINKKDFSVSYWDWKKSGMHPKIATKAPPAQYLNWIHHIEPVNDSIFYASLLTKLGMLAVNKYTGEVQSVPAGPQKAITMAYFAFDEKHFCVAGWNEGLYRTRNPAGNAPPVKHERIPGMSDYVSQLANFDSTHLLVGTKSSGLYLLDKNTEQFSSYRRQIGDIHSLPSGKVNCTFKDSRNIWWIGTGAGLAKYDPSMYKFEETTFISKENDFTTFSSTLLDDGRLVVCTSAGLMKQMPDGTFSQIKFKDADADQLLIPTLLSKSPTGEQILGTENSFYKLRETDNKLTPFSVAYIDSPGGLHIKPYGHGIYQVRDILYDTVHGHHGFWVAVLGYGVEFYDSKEQSFCTLTSNSPGSTTNSIGSNLTRKLAKDSKGNIWVTTAQGLYMWSRKNNLCDNKFVAYLNEPGNKHSLAHNDISDIWIDANDNIWLTTNGGGLCMYDGEKFNRYPLPNVTGMFGMLPDRLNRIWIITQNGLEVFDTRTHLFYHVDVNEPELNSRIAPYFSNRQKGLAGFVAENKFFSFIPENFVFDTAHPPLYLASMDIMGVDYLHNALNGFVDLTPRERFINFTVSALQYKAPESIRFQYRLEGLEEKWNASTTGELKYTNLSPGKYTLIVRSTNPVGQYGPEFKLASFKIAAPFYATWWFFILCVASAALVTYAFYRYRINQLLKLQRVRNKIARDLHDDVGSTLGSISLFSEAAKQYLGQGNDAGAQKMLGKIGDTSREMIDNMSDIVWSVNPQNDSVKHLINRMRSFAGDLVASTDISVQFNCDSGIDEMKLSMEQRKNLFLIFKETIYNSVKYADCRNIFIEIKKHDKGILMWINDDGKGFDVNNYTSKNGNGLRNMKSRAAEIAARYEIESVSGKGTATKVLIDD